jgi:hypothetical protein
MTALHHILVAVAYTLVAAVIAVSVPHFLPHVGPDAGAVIGGVVLIGSALLHEDFARQEGEARRVADISRLNGEIRGVYSAPDLAGAEIDRLKDTIEILGLGGAGSTANRDVESVIAEVKVLQVLVQQLSELRPAPRQTAFDNKINQTRTLPKLILLMNLRWHRRPSLKIYRRPLWWPRTVKSLCRQTAGLMV